MDGLASELWLRFSALPVVERRVLEQLAVSQAWLNKQAIDELLSGAQLHDSSQLDLESKLAAWSAQGLLRLDHHSHEFRVAPALAHELLTRLAQDERFASLLLAARQHRPVERLSRTMQAALARELILSLYAPASHELVEYLARLREQGRRDDEGGLWVNALGHEPAEGQLTALSDTQLALYLGSLIPEAVIALPVISSALLDAAVTRASVLNDEVVALLSMLLSMRGDAERAREILNERAGRHAAAALAFCELTAGRLGEARVLALRAIEPGRTNNASTIPLPFSLWMTLLALTDDDPAAIAFGEGQLTTKAMTSHYAIAVHALRLFATFRRGERDADLTRGFVRDYAIDEDWDEALCVALCRRLCGVGLSEDYVDKLQRMRELASTRGYLWVQNEAERQLENSSQGMRLLYVSEAPWERTLRALSSLLAHGETVELGADEGEWVAWCLVLNGTSPRISARVQQRKATRETTRHVTLRKLIERMESLPERDRAVLSHIVESKADREKSEPGLAPEAALALVGHPHVFGDEDCRDSLSVVRGTPWIEAVTEGEEIRIAVNPRALAEAAVVCVREAHDRVAVYGLTTSQASLARLLRTGLRLPVSARDKAQSVLSGMVEHFPLATEDAFDLGSSRIESVPTDRRLSVDLWPSGQGLSVRVVAVPLGEAPTFWPGTGSRTVIALSAQEQRVRKVRGERDLADELARLDALLTACPMLKGIETARTITLETRAEGLELLLGLQKLGEDVRIRWPARRPLSVLGERDVRDMRLDLTMVGGWLRPDGDLEIDEALKVSMAELLERYARREGRFIQLENGQFVALTEQLEKILSGLSVAVRKENDTRLIAPLVADVLFDFDAFRSVHLDEETRARLIRLEEARELSPELPEGFAAELRPYQHEGYVWLRRLARWGAGACLADDMGLGKTPQTLAALLAEAPEGPSLVVAPMSVCDNWLTETRKFAPKLRPRTLFAGDRDALLADAGPYDLIVASYGIMQQEIERLERLRFRVVVLDEAQAIKNAGTQRARAALRLSAEHRIALTGTPVENHLGELWSIFAFLNPSLLGTSRAFEERFARPIQRDRDERAAAALKRMISPFLLRRKKSDVLSELPEKTEVTIKVEPSPEEAALFDTLREQAMRRLTDTSKPADQRMRILAEIMRLRRAACHPDLVAPEAAVASSKMETFEALLMELREEGHRALVFSQFVDYLSLVRTRLDALGVPYQYLDGSSSREQRARAVEAFQSGSGDVFLISLRAGGFGLNLTAADYVIHLDPWWNPAVEDQASDRAHRIGQTRPVTVYRLLMRGSIEEKILRLHHDKRELSDRLLDGTSSASALSADQLLSLLSEQS
jgi:superfamily II DNA or RNA helicase